MKRKPNMKPAKPMKRPASATQPRHPASGKFVKGIGTPMVIPQNLTTTLGR